MKERSGGRSSFRVRTVILIARLLTRAQRVLGILAEETALAWLSEADREELAAAIYAGRSEYAPGGSVYERGLFDWERLAISHAAFPRSGTILVPAAGAGREVLPLSRLGYDVIGFDACAELVGSGRTAIREAGSSAVLVEGTFEEFERAVGGAQNRLSSILHRRAPAAVMIGWTSFSCLTSHEARLGFLRAVRTLAPTAPVVLSYLRGPRRPPPSRLRRMLRRVYVAAGSPGRASDGLAFISHAGVMQFVDEQEIADLAERTGYTVAVSDEKQSWALLTRRNC